MVCSKHSLVLKYSRTERQLEHKSDYTCEGTMELFLSTYFKHVVWTYSLGFVSVCTVCLSEDVTVIDASPYSKYILVCVERFLNWKDNHVASPIKLLIVKIRDYTTQ